MIRIRLSACASALATVLLLLGLGCASVPARPVPIPEAKPTLPEWYPEKPWDQSEAAQRVYFKGKVVFDTAKHNIRPESEKVLTRLLDYLAANDDISRIRLEGHTDSRSSEEYNQALSERRAMAVANWLVDRGLDHMRILAVAFGETRPIAPNDTAAGRQENRRAAFTVAEVGGLRFRGQDPTAGGLVLEVQSKEEREKEKEVAKVPEYVPPPIKPTRDIFEEDKKEQLEKPLDASPPPSD